MKLRACLSDLGITDASTFEGCDDVDDEFKVIRKVYLKKVLAEHPVSSSKSFCHGQNSSSFFAIWPFQFTLNGIPPPTPSPRHRIRAGMQSPFVSRKRLGRCFENYSTAAA